MNQTALPTNLPANRVNLDASFVKISVLAALEIAAAFLFGLALLWYLSDSVFGLVYAASAAAAFLVLFTLNVFFIKSSRRQALLSFFASLAAAVSFYGLVSGLFLAGFFIFFLMFLSARNSGRRALENMLAVKFFSVSRRVLPKAATALAFFIALIYYVSLPATSAFFVSRDSFGKFLETVPFESFGFGFSFALPVGDVVKNIASGQVGGDPRLGALPPAARAAILAEAEAAVLRQASKFLEIKINPAESFGGVLYKAAEARFSASSFEIQRIVILIFTALLFLFIKGVGVPFNFIVALVAFLIYEALLALGFATLVLENRSREIIII